MKLVKGQVYLFDVKTEEEVILVLKGLYSCSISRKGQSDSNELQIIHAVGRTILIDKGGDILYEASESSISEGLWLDVNKFIEEHTPKKETMEIGDSTFYVEDVMKALEGIPHV